jgi:hypothetical protein
MPLSLHDLGVRAVDRSPGGEHITEQLIVDVLDAALSNGDVTLGDILTELRSTEGKRTYGALMIQIGGPDGLRFPLWELAADCQPNDRSLIRAMAHEAIGVATILEIGKRQNDEWARTHFKQPFSWAQWVSRIWPFGS